MHSPFYILLALATAAAVHSSGHHRSRRHLLRSNEGTEPWREMEQQLTEGLEDAELMEFFEIKSDGSLTTNQRRERFNRWAEKVNKEVEMEKYLEKVAEWKEEEQKQLEIIAEQLGGKIKAVLEVASDEDATKQEQKEEISRIIKDSPETVTQLLRSLFPDYSSRQKRGLSYGCRLAAVQARTPQGHVTTQYQYICGAVYQR